MLAPTHVSVSTKSPVIEIDEITAGEFPKLSSVTARALLWVPTGCERKLSEAGDALS